jgi:hypothetical protein
VRISYVPFYKIEVEIKTKARLLPGLLHLSGADPSGQEYLPLNLSGYKVAKPLIIEDYTVALATRRGFPF